MPGIGMENRCITKRKVFAKGFPSHYVTINELTTRGKSFKGSMYVIFIIIGRGLTFLRICVHSRSVKFWEQYLRAQILALKIR